MNRGPGERAPLRAGSGTTAPSMRAPAARTSVCGVLAAVLVAGACTVGPPGGRAGPLGSEHGITSVVADPELEAVVDAIVVEAIEGGPLAGVAVGVGRGGELVLAKGWGLADMENDVPVSAETVFRVGSLTKQYTAAAILRLVERGEIALDDDLSRFLPDYPTQGHTVTITHLLNHTSGIKSYTNLGEQWLETVPLDLAPEELLPMFQDVPFEFDPGEKFSYNNSGYFLLGLIIEEASGRTYEEYLQEQVLDVAGVTATYYCDNRPIIKYRAEGYAVDEAGELVNDDLIGMRQPYSAGALCANVIDLVDWTHALAAGRVVSEESYRAMVTPLPLRDGTQQDYGFGLGVAALDGHRRIAHDGGINGFVSMLAHYPDDDVVVAVLANSENGNPGAIERRVARAALGLPEPETPDATGTEEE